MDLGLDILSALVNVKERAQTHSDQALVTPQDREENQILFTDDGRSATDIREVAPQSSRYSSLNYDRGCSVNCEDEEGFNQELEDTFQIDVDPDQGNRG